MVEKIKSSETERKTKHIQIRTTKTFYTAIRTFAEKNNISMTECMELGFQLLLEKNKS